MSGNTRARNWSLALLFATAALSLFDRQVINILAQDIKVDLEISDTELGLLTGTAFGIVHSIVGVPMGRLADRINRVKLIAGALAVWSSFTVLCGMAGGFAQLFIARMGVGVGEAGWQPAGISLITDIFPEARRTLAQSVLLVGTTVGSFLGLLVGGYVASIWGWRTAFIIAGIPGFIFATLIVTTMRDPLSSATAGVRRSGDSFLKTLQTLASRRKYPWLVLVFVCMIFFYAASSAWLPPFFIRVHGMTTAEIGGYAALGVGLGGGIGILGGGLLCDLLRNRVRDIELKMVMVSLGLAVPALLITVLAADRTLALAAMLVGNVCAVSFLGPGVALVQQEATPESRALAMAICISVPNIVSVALVLPLVGSLSDALTPTYGTGAIRYALAFSAVVAGVIGTFALSWYTKHSRGELASH